MKKIMFAGCWHANRTAMKHVVKYAASQNVDTIIHTGDFIGYGRASHSFITSLHYALENAGIDLIFVRGNHDDLRTINNFITSRTPEGFAILKNSPRIKYAPNGLRWNIENVSFVALGGAQSVDWKLRISGIDWWYDETASPDEVNKATAHGHSDFVIMHDVPIGTPLPTKVTESRNDDWDYQSAYFHRVVLQDAMDIIKPDVMVSGHMHAFGEGDVTVQDDLAHYVILDRGDYVAQYDSPMRLKAHTKMMEIDGAGWNFISS